MSDMEIFRQLARIHCDDEYGDTGEEQAESNDRESPSTPWSGTSWQDRPVQLPESRSSLRRPKSRFELLPLWQSFVQLELQFPILVIRKEQEYDTACGKHNSDDECCDGHAANLRQQSASA